jgi:hypothetical protein
VAKAPDRAESETGGRSGAKAVFETTLYIQHPGPMIDGPDVKRAGCLLVLKK